MTTTIALAAEAEASERDLLRFLTCGSVDDGKSTLIGRLLYETGQVPEDQLAVLRRDSRRFGTDGENLDYALLLDGLEAEREQGITIDVAYRYMSTARRSFIIADTPGHEQYTRNMATGASTCQAAVVLVDAAKGITTQTLRHSRIVSLFGIRHVILAVNKIDLVAQDAAAFEAIRADYLKAVADFGFVSITSIPVSARQGFNLTTLAPQTPWYSGPCLIEALEALPVVTERQSRPFRLAVQYVNRPNASFRGYAGTISSGLIAVGDTIAVCPAGHTARVAQLFIGDTQSNSASAGDAVTLVLDRQVDVARGDILAPATSRPKSSDQLKVSLVWMADQAFDGTGRYQVKIGTQVTPARLTLEQGQRLLPNEVGQGQLSLSTPVAVDAFADDPSTGALVLIDREQGLTVGAGVVTGFDALSTDVHQSPSAVDRTAHEAINGHQGGVIWLTGLSGAGKSSIAQKVQGLLHASGCRTVLLDGDNLRHGLNRDLGFTDADRTENIRRTGEVAYLFAETGTIVLCALISPQREAREAVRARFDGDNFVEVYVKASLDACRARDPKGLYAKADEGRIAHFTGIASAYEAPTQPDLSLDTDRLSIRESATAIRALIQSKGWLS